MMSMARPRVTGGDPDPRAGQPPFEVDWHLAGRWAGRLAPPGPAASREELEDLVASLRAAAGRARPLAMRASRLRAAVVANGPQTPAQVLVVDRPGWARAAAESFDAMTGGSFGAHPCPGSRRSGALDGVRTASATSQTAALLSVLAPRVLGQFDPFALGAPPGGRLLLVAPNVLKTERTLRADPADFRLWVAIHEQTHALQFAAAPWLADHLRREVAVLLGDLAESAGHDVTGVMEALVRALRHGAGKAPFGRGGRRDAADDIGDLGILELLLDPEQRRRVERVTAVMSLLEGHADVTMDAVGERVIPTVRRLRARFEARRTAATGLDRVLRRLLGMDAKLAQYRRGAAFVRAVRAEAGRAGLDPVWSEASALPTPREISDPLTWVRRVHG